MRILLPNSKKFIDEILQKNNSSLRHFARQMNINYSNLKQYRRGEKTFPLDVYNILISMSPNKSYWESLKVKFSDNWGAIKGGKKSVLSDLSHKRLERARHFRKIKFFTPRYNKFLCEFYGALLGDGCISKYVDYSGTKRIVICLSGNKKLDSFYWNYLKQKLSSEHNLYSYYYEYKDRNVCMLIIKNKSLSMFFHEVLGFPIGKKYKSISIHKKILSLDWKINKYVLRGLFDTDGCIIANKREKYKYPWIAIASKSKRFREQIKDMLKRQGYPAYITGKDVNVRGIRNVNRWFNDIGSSNPRNLKKYEYFLKNKNLPARLSLGP